MPDLLDVIGADCARVLPPRSATAVFASRAETPMRSAPVMSFSSAQRPVSSSASSQAASLRGRSILPPRLSFMHDLGTASAARDWTHACARLRLVGRRPEQGDGLGQIADEIVGKLEQDRIDALGDEGADEAGLGVLEGQRAGQRGERIAALGIRRRAEITPSSAAVCRGGTARRRGGRAVRRNGSRACLRRGSPAGERLGLFVAIAEQGAAARPRFLRRAPSERGRRPRHASPAAFRSRSRWIVGVSPSQSA